MYPNIYPGRYHPGSTGTTRVYTRVLIPRCNYQTLLLTRTMPTALSAFEASLRRAETACPMVLGSSPDATTATRGVGTPFCPIICRHDGTAQQGWDWHFLPRHNLQVFRSLLFVPPDIVELRTACKACNERESSCDKRKRTNPKSKMCPPGRMIL